MDSGTPYTATALISVNRFFTGCSMSTVIDSSGKTWTCPLLESEAINYGIDYSGTMVDTNGQTFVTMINSQAKAYCNSLGRGYYLPKIDELEALFAQFGNMYDYAEWPVDSYYWSSSIEQITPPSRHFNILLSDGYVNSDYDDYFFSLATCTRPML
jgi:hypothetical protein